MHKKWKVIADMTAVDGDDDGEDVVPPPPPEKPAKGKKPKKGAKGAEEELAAAAGADGSKWKAVKETVTKEPTEITQMKDAVKRHKEVRPSANITQHEHDEHGEEGAASTKEKWKTAKSAISKADAITSKRHHNKEVRPSVISNAPLHREEEHSVLEKVQEKWKSAKSAISKGLNPHEIQVPVRSSKASGNDADDVTGIYIVVSEKHVGHPPLDDLDSLYENPSHIHIKTPRTSEESEWKNRNSTDLEDSTKNSEAEGPQNSKCCCTIL